MKRCEPQSASSAEAWMTLGRWHPPLSQLSCRCMTSLKEHLSCAANVRRCSYVNVCTVAAVVLACNSVRLVVCLHDRVDRGLGVCFARVGRLQAAMGWCKLRNFRASAVSWSLRFSATSVQRRSLCAVNNGAGKPLHISASQCGNTTHLRSPDTVPERVCVWGGSSVVANRSNSKLPAIKAQRLYITEALWHMCLGDTR